MHSYWLFFLLLIFICRSDSIHAQLVKSRDGVSLGKRSEFIATCVKSSQNSMMKLNGLEIKTYQYCACVCDNLIPNIDSWEMEKAFKEDKIVELFSSGDNGMILMECVQENMTLSDDYSFSNSENQDITRRAGINACINSMLEEDGSSSQFSPQQAEDYCTCAIDKLLSSGYTYKDLLKIEDQNSPIFNEIAVPCMQQALNGNQEDGVANTYNSQDIHGGGVKCLVPLVDYFGNGFKLKINISGISKYYLFDTGASDMIIDRETERELLINGSLNQKSYLGKTEFVLANNQRVKAEKITVDNIKIGDYVVDNVVISVIDEGSLLCGKSFLDKFKKWEVDVKNKVLTVYK